MAKKKICSCFSLTFHPSIGRLNVKLGKRTKFLTEIEVEANEGKVGRHVPKDNTDLKPLSQLVLVKPVQFVWNIFHRVKEGV